MDEEARDSHTLAERLTPLLGEGWSYRPKFREPGVPYSWAEIRHRDGYGVCVTVGGYQNRGRVSIFGCWPESKDMGRYMPHMCLGEENQRITVDASRPVEKIAREITGRFLPRYLNQWHRCKSRQAINDQADAERRAVRDRLALFGVGFTSHCGGEPGFEGVLHLLDPEVEGRVYARVHVTSGTSVEMKLSVHPDLAKRVLRVLQEPVLPVANVTLTALQKLTNGG